MRQFASDELSRDSLFVSVINAVSILYGGVDLKIAQGWYQSLCEAIVNGQTNQDELQVTMGSGSDMMFDELPFAKVTIVDIYEDKPRIWIKLVLVKNIEKYRIYVAQKEDGDWVCVCRYWDAGLHNVKVKRIYEIKLIGS